MILAGDIGGTKTLLGIFEAEPVRPRPIVVHTFATCDYPDLPSLLAHFAARLEQNVPFDRVCLGVAGPVIESAARLTNVPWHVEAAHVTAVFGVTGVTILNDLEAKANAVPVLDESELYTLQEGAPRSEGNMALIAAGTGLGEALLHQVDGRFVPSATEAGHADWAPRTDREIAVLRYLIERFGRAQVEHVISGRGLVNLHRVTHAGTCAAIEGVSDTDAPSAIATAALEGRCPGCVDALSIFVEAYGAEAGNLALRSVAVRGVYVGGGIAPKILPALQDGRFVRAFCDKAPLDGMLGAIPVKVILNPLAGLLGAAVHAARSPARIVE
jgi:glucokinase